MSMIGNRVSWGPNVLHVEYYEIFHEKLLIEIFSWIRMKKCPRARLLWIKIKVILT